MDQPQQPTFEESIFRGLTLEQKDQIIQTALARMTTARPANVFGRQQVIPIDEAFDAALKDLMTEAARNLLHNNPALQGRITDLLGKAILKFIAKRDDDVAEALRDALAEAIIDNRRGDYDY